MVDAAAPVTGAAVPAKTGTPAKPSAFGDFASLVHEAQQRGGQALSGQDGAADDSSTPTDASDVVVASDAGAARGAIDTQDVVAEKAPTFTNLAGFFRSMRNQPVAQESTEAEHASGRAPQAEIAIGAPVAESDEDEVLTAPVIVATPDAQMPQPTQKLTMLPDVQVEQELTAVAEGQEALVAPALPQAVSLTHTSLDDAGPADAAATATTFPEIASMSTSTAASSTAAPAAVADVVAAPASPMAESNLTDSTTPTIAAPSTPLAAEIQAQIKDTLKASAADSATPSSETSSTNAPIAEATTSFTSTAATIESPSADTTTPATVTQPLYARPRATSFVNDATQNSAAATKLKLSTTANDLAAPRAERSAVGARPMPSMFVMPHTAMSPLAAAAGLVTPASVAVVETQVRDQIVQSLRVQILQGGGEATIELNPEVLGKVQVAVKVDNGSVTATVQAATAQVREWVTTHRDELSQTLAQQGLRLDKLEVAEAPKEQPARDQAREQRQAPRESARQRRDDRAHDTDTFELQEPQETV